MVSAKDVILTAIKLKGIQHVKDRVLEYAENSLCSVGYVKQIIRKVEKEETLISFMQNF